MAGAGYYIAPSGDIIEVDTYHIDMVLKHPEKFLMTKKELEEIYKKHNEPLGLEGKAREEVLSNLIKKGWVRIRYNDRIDAFTVQINRLDKKRKDQLAMFAKHALDGIKGQKYYPTTGVKILNLEANILGEFTLSELAKDILYKEAKIISIEQYQPIRISIIQKVIQKLKKDIA